MRQRLFAIVAALSLLAGAATAALWARSMARAYDFVLIHWRPQNDHLIQFFWVAGVEKGGVKVYCSTSWFVPGSDLRRPGGVTYDSRPAQRYPSSYHSPTWSAWGFEINWWTSGTPSDTYTYVITPMWFWLGVSMICPLWGFHRRRHGRGDRERRGLCVQCGYDLRGSRERCPECGAPIAALP